MPRDYTEVYEFKITLQGIHPPIWRRIQVPADYSFWDLHVAIQDAMGWTDSHLHVFRILNPGTDDTEEIGIPNEDRFVGDPEVLPGWELSIADYFLEGNPTAEYEYDFGDSWEHEVALEKILHRKPGSDYPVCLAGERACPPEDCGGPLGYDDMLRILKDPTHEEHKDTVTWVGGSYDPERFEPNKVHFDNPKKRWETAFADG
jgi:hypothetical protein